MSALGPGHHHLWPKRTTAGQAVRVPGDVTVRATGQVFMTTPFEDAVNLAAQSSKGVCPFRHHYGELSPDGWRYRPVRASGFTESSGPRYRIADGARHPQPGE